MHHAPDRIFWSFCENDMLRNGNLELKMGVSRAAHKIYTYGSTSRGGGGGIMKPTPDN